MVLTMTPEQLPAQVSRCHVNNITLEVATAGPVEGPLVILLHGFPDLWQGWHLQIAPLAAAGFRVLLPNQRGYGGSDKPRGVSSYDIDVLADDIVALANSEGRATFSIIGHDWGGIVGWWVAARFPHRVDRLAILAAPHPGVFKRYLLRNPTQLLRSWYAAVFQLPWLPEALLSAHDFALMFRAVRSTSQPRVFDHSDRRYLTAGWSQAGSLTAMLNYYRALARRGQSSLQVHVESPVLVMYGRHDPAEEPGLNKASKALCQAAKFVEMEQAHHWLQREEPDRVNRELLAFLQ
jgi:pimeloyl-ACP methyl ester carboxylesterase